MTLPKAKKFPKLPEGYVFFLSYDGIDDTFQQPYYSLYVLNAGTGEILLSEINIVESYVLERAQRLAALAALRTASTRLTDEVHSLNKELRTRPSR